MVEKKGRTAADQLDALRARGLDDQDFVEVLGIVAMNIFTNYFNHLANPEIDFPRLDSARGEP